MAKPNINGLKSLLDRMNIIRLTDAQVAEIEAKVAALEDAANGGQPPVPPTEDLQFKDNQDLIAGLPVNGPMDAETVSRLESELGRNLDPDEIHFGRIKREYSIQPREITTDFDKVAAFDRNIAEAQKLVDDQRRNQLTEAEFILQSAIESKEKHLADLAAEEAMQAHTAMVAPQLEALTSVRRDLLKNPLRTNEDLETVDAAFKLVSTPGHDPKKAIESLNAVNAIAPRHLQEKREQLTAKLVAGGLTESEAAEIVAKRIPDATPTPVIQVGKTATGNSGKATNWDLVNSPQAKHDETDKIRSEAFTVYLNTSPNAEGFAAAKEKFLTAKAVSDEARKAWIETATAEGALG